MSDVLMLPFLSLSLTFTEVTDLDRLKRLPNLESLHIGVDQEHVKNYPPHCHIDREP